MKAWEEYALCDSTGEIKNIAVFPINTGAHGTSMILAREQYGEDAFSFNVTQYMATLGDTIENGKVYHNGEELSALPTEEQEIESLNQAVDELIIAVLGG